MDFSSLIDALNRFLDTPLIWIDDFVIQLVDLLLACVVLGASWILARYLRRLAGQLFRAESEEEEGVVGVAEPLVYWTAVTAGSLLALAALGLDVATVRDVFNETLFRIGDTAVTLVSLVFFTAIVGLTWVLSRILRRALERAFGRRKVDAGTTATTKRLIHYSVMAVGLALGFENLGVDLGALLAAGAFLAVGIGFAMQNVVQNFVSGLILMVERSIKPGDVLEVDGEVVSVERMGIRSTVARTRDGEEVILPNSLLVQNSVKNYTFLDSFYRLRAVVGVEYGSDMRQVLEVLTETAEGIEWRIPDREPIVLLTEFGNSSVNFDVSVWMNDPWTAPRARSKLNQAVWFALQDAGVTIAFPQLDVHFDPPIEDAVQQGFPRAS